MNQILNKVRDVDPNNGDAIKEALSPFFQNLSKHKDVDCARWLRALENVINRFPKYCMSQRGTIETYLTHFLDNTNYFIVIEAAKCAHALQQVRPTQEKTATAKSSWRGQMNALCNAAHALIGALFPNAVDIYQQSGKNLKEQNANSPLTIALLRLQDATSTTQNNNALNKQVLLCTRLRNVFVFLQAMLVEVYPVAKPIRPQTILDVIVRTLSVSSGTNISQQSLSDVVMVKTQALRCLDALVACLGPNLIPFSPLVFKFVMQTLKWSMDNPSEQSRRVRISAYSSLARWLGTLHAQHAAPRGRGWEDELTDYIIGDVTPHRHVVQLKMSSQPTKNLSKKAKRKLANSMLMESTISSHMPGEKNKITISDEITDEVAISALECAETFLHVCGIFLKPATHKRFQERLVRECYSFELYTQNRVLALLRALEACRKSAPPTVPPPTQYCLQLYSVMINSTQREISNFCTQALLDIRMHLHCSPPSLNFAIEVQPEQAKEIEENKKSISARNRAALEALLGVDKIPQQNEEIITIPDEPSNKRRKLEVTDNISLSSDSVNSVEISDDSAENDVEEVEVIIEHADNDYYPDEEVIIQPVSEEIEEQNLIIDFDVHEKDTQLYNDVNDKDSSTPVKEMPFTKDTQISEDIVDSTQPEVLIHEAETQMPMNVLNEDESETPLSMEVAYDYLNTSNENVTVLDKLEGDNLPSSNDTDDIQITCGQVVKNSQDDVSKKTDIEAINVNIKENGIDSSTEKPVQNGDNSESVTTSVSNKDVTVEDMLADFVDEVNDDPQNPATA